MVAVGGRHHGDATLGLSEQDLSRDERSTTGSATEPLFGQTRRTGLCLVSVLYELVDALV
ncbi:hypothetical protein GCM10027059_37290 [Myceligenerans halotolerans]